ncbi:hypothetical protein K2X30_09180 [bacterium]|jgi:hypothetical protein|nr:hypothetical protein [bacterium]
MKNLKVVAVLFVVASVLGTQAQAVTYAYYKVSCKMYGTEQVLGGYEKDLPNRLTVKYELTVDQDTGNVLQTKGGINLGGKDKSWNDISTQALLPIAATFHARVCRADRPAMDFSLKFGGFSPDQMARVLSTMGAMNIPDLSGAIASHNTAQNEMTLADISDHSTYCSAVDVKPGKVLNQIHFPLEKNNGLSYHIKLEDCEGSAISARGEESELGE